MSRYITIDTPPTALDSNGLPYQRLDAPLAAFGGNDANALGQFSSALSHNVQNYRDQLRQQQQLLAHESAANDALTGFRQAVVQAGRQYTGLCMKDAVDGHDGYLQAITQSRDDALRELPRPAKALLKPHLDRAFNVARQLGQDHQMQQDHAWSDQSSLDSLDADAQEAVLHRNNPVQVQALADRAIGEWAKIGERKGWDDNTVQQLANQSNGRLYGAVIDQHLRDGNLEGAQTVLRKSQPHLDPDTLERLRQKVAAGGANGDAITPDGTLAGGAGQIDPRLVQLADTNGTNPAADTTMSDAPSGIIGGQQRAQLPDGGQIEGEEAQNNANKNGRIAELSQPGTAYSPRKTPSSTSNSKITTSGPGPNPYGNSKQTAKPAAGLKGIRPGNEVQASATSLVDKTMADKLLDPLVTGALNGTLGNDSKNIGHINADGTKWEGAGKARGRWVEPTSGDSGVRMSVKNLINYGKALETNSLFRWQRDLKNVPNLNMNLPFTLHTIASKWAPGHDGANKPDKWAAGVAELAGIGMDQIIEPDNEAMLGKIMRAINKQEHGKLTVSEDDFARGVKTGMGQEVPPKSPQQRQSDMLENITHEIDGMSFDPEYKAKLKAIAASKLNAAFR